MIDIRKIKSTSYTCHRRTTICNVFKDKLKKKFYFRYNFQKDLS